jgi:catechol 2,3-dioxygenase-like lactoylglutathione lyase family enzyme
MISYVTIGCKDFAASRRFFDATLGALGYAMTHDYSEYGTVGYSDPAMKGTPGEQTAWIMQTPYDKQPASVGNGSMVGFVANTRAQVDAFHAAALANGGTSEGAPGLRENYGPNMYLAYVRDPMGNKFSALCTAAQ